MHIFLNRFVRFDCDDMLDANDDGRLDSSDPVAILSWLFLDGMALPAPFLECNFDGGLGDQLDCTEPNCRG